MTDAATKDLTQVTYADQAIFIERDFDAPIERVFAAYTTASAVENWWGPARYETKVDKLDPRTGGEWRFVHPDPDGGVEYGFHGIFHTVEKNALIVQTFEYEGAPGHVSLEILRFTDLGGRTRLNATSIHEAPEALEAMKASGMQSGMRETYNRLAALTEA